MNKQEFNKAFELAKKSVSFDNIHIFEGFGLHSYDQIMCTVNDVAALIKWQAINLNGTIDADALNEIWDNRRKFIIAM